MVGGVNAILLGTGFSPTVLPALRISNARVKHIISTGAVHIEQNKTEKRTIG